MVSRRRWVKEIALALVLSFPGGILFQFRRFWLLIDSWSNAEFLFGKIASAKTGTSPPSTPPNMTWWDWPFTSQGSTTLMVIGLLWIGACVLWRVGPPRAAGVRATSDWTRGRDAVGFNGAAVHGAGEVSRQTRSACASKRVTARHRRFPDDRFAHQRIEGAVRDRKSEHYHEQVSASTEQSIPARRRKGGSSFRGACRRSIKDDRAPRRSGRIQGDRVGQA